MTFRKTACLATMLMCCCSQTVLAANNWDEHVNAQKSADEKILTSSDFTEVFKEGGTQKADDYNFMYIGHVVDERSGSSASSNLSAAVNNNNGVMGAGLNAKNLYGGKISFTTSLNGTTCNFEVKSNELVLESGSKVFFASGGYAEMLSEKIYNADEAKGVPCAEGIVSGNSVKVDDGASVDALIGGFASQYYANVDGTSSVLDNTVTVTGDTIKVAWGGFSNTLKSYINSNTVILNNVVAESGSIKVVEYGFTLTAANCIIGGVADGIWRYRLQPDLWESLYYKGEHVASENTVTINNSKVESLVYGGLASGTPEFLEVEKDTVTASGNTVTLTDTEFSGSSIVSGSAESSSAYQSSSTSATANENKLVLNGGSYSSEDGIDIYGGYASISVHNDGTTDGVFSTEARNNRIELRNGSNGAPVFSENTLIFGGYASSTGADGKTIAGTSTGNSLNFYDVKDMKAGNISNFQILNYEYQKMCAGDVIMELAGADYDDSGIDADAAQPTSIVNAAVSVRAVSLVGSNGGDFEAGDKVVLLKNANGIDAEGITKSVTAPKGATLLYDVAIETSEDKTELLLTGRGTKVRPGTKAIAEGTASGLALAGEVSNATIGLLRDLTLIDGSITPFVHVQGSSMRHETGSSIKMSSVSLVTGLGYGFETSAGNFGVGAFFEYGKGSYTTSNSFDSRSDIDGDGNAWYMGGGILAKMEFLQTGPGHFYLEGSAHMGTLHNEYDSNDLTDVYGNVARFDMDSPYYSLHGGLGYIWNMAEGHDLDVYGKYIWTRVQGTDDTLTTKDQFEFDDMDSNRIRFGVRYSYKGSERFSPYVGAAFEHEFSGTCNSMVYGHPVAAPSFEGSSGMGELGLIMKPSEDLPISINLGVQGYVGQRQGIAGDCNITYEF